MVFFGVPEVRSGARALRFRSRKTLALLAYLVLEPGLHARDKLAALFWPEAEASAGRASLRNALAQINSELGTLRSTREAVRWNLIDFDSDVRRLELAFRAVNRTDATPDLESLLERAANSCRGELLEGVTLMDAPDFDDWLIARREIARGWLDGVLERLCGLYADSGRVPLALEVAQRRVRLEPLNESAHQGVIGLHLRSGNRTAALEAYRACKAILETELGLEPSTETETLLDRASESPKVEPPTEERPSNPPSQTRLIGRGEAWARMEDAWNRDQTIFVCGEAGTGKTRLVQEFLATKAGPIFFHSPRPGETSVPYATQVNGLRQIMAALPDLKLEPWVRRELSRVVPELGERPQEPIASQEDKLRLFDAFSEIVHMGLCRVTAAVTEDLQYIDAFSLEISMYMTSKWSVTGGPCRFINTFRANELSPAMTLGLRGLVDSGLGVLIELEPLLADGVGEMLADLVSDSSSNAERDDLAAALHRFTGGNPLFVLETVRALTARGSLESLTADRFENRRRVAGLPRTPKVQMVIQRRLERLSAAARDLAQVAAVAGEHFTLELGAKVLETPILELSRTAVELEAAHVWRGLRFSHDLLFETTLENIPESFSLLLHGRVLDALEGASVPAAVLAEHAFATCRWQKAFQYSLDAAEFAGEVYAAREALEHGLRAWQLLREAPQGFDPITNVTSDQRISLYYRLRASLEVLRAVSRDDELTTEMLVYARSIGDARLEIRVLMPFDNGSRRGYEQEKRLSSKALEIAEQIGDRGEWVIVQNNLMRLEYTNAEFEAALTRSEAILPVARALYTESDPQNINILEHPFFDCLRWTAQANLWSGRWDDALIGQQECEALLRPFPAHRYSMAHCRMWLAVGRLNLGQLEESLPLGRAAVETYYELRPNSPFTSVSSFWHSMALLDHGDLVKGIEFSTRGFDLVNVPGTDVFYRAPVYWGQAYALQLLGLFERPLELALIALEENREQTRRDGWGVGMQDYFSNLLCVIHATRDNWEQAYEYAKLATQSRFQINNELGAHSPRMRRDLEMEALLRGGEINLVRESVRRLGEFAGHYARRKIPYLRALSALEVWEGNTESATHHLLEARALMIPIGLPNERWTLEAKLAELYEKNGDLERALDARNHALEIVSTLGDSILDEASRTVFLEFARRQVFRVESASV